MGDSRYHEDRFLKVFHGSDHEIQKPVYLGGKIYKGNLGNQIFLKSEKAFQRIRWLSAYEVLPQDRYQQEDIQARQEVNRF